MSHTVRRALQELHALGIERFVVNGPSFGADRAAASEHRRLVVNELLPALR